MDLQELTERQSEIYRFLKEKQEKDGEIPSHQKLADELGIQKTAVRDHLQALQRRGWIKRQPESYTFTSEAKQEECAFPLVATVPAGIPQEAFDDNHEMVHFNHDFFGKGDLKAVKVSGDSMAGDLIGDGDIALIKIQNRVGKNDIAVVRIAKQEVTLKRFRKNNDHVELIPSNPEFSVRKVALQDFEVLGKYMGLVRRAR